MRLSHFLVYSIAFGTVTSAQAQGNFWIWGADSLSSAPTFAPAGAITTTSTNGPLTRYLCDDAQLAPGFTGQLIKGFRILVFNGNAVPVTFRRRIRVHAQSSTQTGLTGIFSPGTYISGTTVSATIASQAGVRYTTNLTQPGPAITADNLWIGACFDNNVNDPAYATIDQLNLLGIYIQPPAYGTSTDTLWRSTNPSIGNTTYTPTSGAQFQFANNNPTANLSLNLAIMGQNYFGDIALQDTVSPVDMAVNRAITFQVFQGTTNMQSTMVNVGTSNLTSAVTVVVPSIAPSWGTNVYDVVFDGGPYLKKTITIMAPAGTPGVAPAALALGTVNMVNGDVDESGEVDAADIDQVIADFGSTWPGGTGNPFSDVDSSGEVDAADIDIVIANFGAVDN